jgi:hypothetical protein
MSIRNRLGAALAVAWLIIVILGVSLMEGRPARSAANPAPTPTTAVIPAP